MASPGFAAVTVLGAYLIFPHTNVRKTAGGVIIGQGEPTMWILVDREVLGKQYARTLRSALPVSDERIFGFIENGAEALPSECESIQQFILTGRFTANARLEKMLERSEKIVLVAPRLFPQEFPLSGHILQNVAVLVGEFSQSPATVSWSQEGKARLLPGIGDFLPDWPSHLLQTQTADSSQSGTESF